MGPPKAQPLTFPFEWGRNIIFTPRDDAEYSAAELRYLSSYPLARICIENNKDMMTKMPYRIQLKPLPGETSKARAVRGKNDKNLRWLTDFFARPNPRQNWQEFLRRVLEDMLVIDAASIYIERDKAGKVIALEWIEGAGITCLVNERGLPPLPPSPAYQQLWEGYPRLDFTTEQLIYRPRNIVPRGTQSSYLYGMSPTEQVAKEIKIGMARLQFIWDFYREGSIPGMIHFVPPGISVTKIQEAQQYLDAAYSGNLAKRRKLQLIQGWQENGHTEQVLQPKEPVLADAYDETHTRKICFAYGTSPQRLMRQMNRASAEQAQVAAEEEGTLPWMEWLKGLVDTLIQQVLALPDYEFVFDPFHEMDRVKQSTADEKDVDNGIYTRNEIRERRGDDPRPEAAADQLGVKTAQGVIPLGQILQPTTAAGTGKGPFPAAKSLTASVEKTNGHTTWATCEQHRGSYPRTHCRNCVQAELSRLNLSAGSYDIHI
jgi:hypothetical protein